MIWLPVARRYALSNFQKKKKKKLLAFDMPSLVLPPPPHDNGIFLFLTFFINILILTR